MMEEHFMRGWNSGHDRFSADIDRGLQFLGGMIRRVSKRLTSGRARDEDILVTRTATADRATKRAVPARAAPTRVTRRR